MQDDFEKRGIDFEVPDYKSVKRIVCTRNKPVSYTHLDVYKRQPPYSPDLNPIEMLWSKMKAILRKLGCNIAALLPLMVAEMCIRDSYSLAKTDFISENVANIARFQCPLQHMQLMWKRNHAAGERCV